MTPNQILEVMICCNEPSNGHFSGYLTGFDIGEMQVGCTLAEEGFWMLFEDNYLKVTNDKFYVAERKRHVGNWCWDKVWMPAESVCRLLNWAFKNDFAWESCPTEFLAILESEQPIQIEHLELLY